MTEPGSPKPKRRNRLSRGGIRRNIEIDHVLVHEPFELKQPRETSAQSDRRIGDGCYVSTTVNNRRYYGVLIDQESLKSASILHFKDEAHGMDINRRMKALKQAQLADNLATRGEDSSVAYTDRKRSADEPMSSKPTKKVKYENDSSNPPTPDGMELHRQVQKFRFVENQDGNSNLGYRILLATYANTDAAAEDDDEKARQIDEACRLGGNFVGEYYYQYETKNHTLEATTSNLGAEDPSSFRVSMGLHTFFQTTVLPPWYPLANLQVGQNKVLSILSMKKDNNGNVIWDPKEESERLANVAVSNVLPMTPRNRFRVCVIGGGISGLSCCTQIFRECEREQIPVEIILLEARDRLGGRLWTDRETFKCDDGIIPFPVDLGASWIHGIELNPLAELAREAGVEFVTSSESVMMFQEGMREVDHIEDEHAGEFFDKLLDIASEECWKLNNDEDTYWKSQSAVRWYAPGCRHSDTYSSPIASEPKMHRMSADMSVDCAVGRAIVKHKLHDFAKLSNIERRMLLWNLKNVEYALGANLSDLSIKFWDIDERHAFEGDHVILRQGYSTVVDYLVQRLRDKGESFQCKLNFPVGKVEYSRKTSSRHCTGTNPKSKQFVELSDSCCVTTISGDDSIPCDFVVSCLPLGVLKQAVSSNSEDTIKFDPELPFSKKDAIEHVGFGLLNKVYLQFATPFWRGEALLNDDQTLFGNATKINPHHYMFFDVGKSLGTSASRPAILMSLISGCEAVKCECFTDKELVDETMETLRAIFSKVNVPEPIAFRTTRWGSDKFSRGSYTFLPPGTTDQDFHILQSPINGNGDSLLLEGSETMRLFFAGEHTTSLHPSMAHGALLSGVRAAKEVVSSMNLISSEEEKFDRIIPMALFRFLNPKAPVWCSLCHRVGTTIREGTLLAFKKGARQVLVHNCCAENCPEVEVFEGNWKNVIRAVIRSKNVECHMCGEGGASISCCHDSCTRSYHFSCGEDTGWRFDKDGKEFHCDQHRRHSGTECVRISLDYYRSKQMGNVSLLCRLCGDNRMVSRCGSLLAFQRGLEMVAVHEKCAQHTSIVDIGEDSTCRLDHEYRNIFHAIDRARICDGCGRLGATIECSEISCRRTFHFPCAEDTNWNPLRQPSFRCLEHRFSKSNRRENSAPVEQQAERNGGLFNHALLSQLGYQPRKDGPGNLDIQLNHAQAIDRNVRTRGRQESIGGESDSDSSVSNAGESQNVLEPIINTGSYVLTSDDGSGVCIETRLVRLFRHSVRDPWNIDFYVTSLENTINSERSKLKSILQVAVARPDPFDEIHDGDMVVSINGVQVGSNELDSLEKVLSYLSQEVDALIEVRQMLVKF